MAMSIRLGLLIATVLTCFPVEIALAQVPPCDEQFVHDWRKSLRRPDGSYPCLAKQLQGELNRLGCRSGTADGQWGGPSAESFVTFLANSRPSLKDNYDPTSKLSEVSAFIGGYDKQGNTCAPALRACQFNNEQKKWSQIHDAELLKLLTAGLNPNKPDDRKEIDRIKKEFVPLERLQQALVALRNRLENPSDAYYKMFPPRGHWLFNVQIPQASESASTKLDYYLAVLKQYGTLFPNSHCARCVLLLHYDNLRASVRPTGHPEELIVDTLSGRLRFLLKDITFGMLQAQHGNLIKWWRVIENRPAAAAALEPVLRDFLAQQAANPSRMSLAEPYWRQFSTLCPKDGWPDGIIKLPSIE